MDAHVLSGAGEVARDDGYAEFYARHVTGVTALVYSLVGSWPVAEDLAQEAFVRAFRDWRRVGGLAHRDAWVRRVAMNLSASRFRRLAAEARAVGRLSRRRAGDVVVAAPHEDDEAFWTLVRSLPRRQAQAVALRYVDDRSVAEIAEVMGCAPGTVKATLHEARKTLLARLDGPDGSTSR